MSSKAVIDKLIEAEDPDTAEVRVIVHASGPELLCSQATGLQMKVLFKRDNSNNWREETEI